MTPGTLHRVEQLWSGPTTIALRFPMTAVVTERYNGAAAIERGPLVYALKVGEAWTRVNAEKPHHDVPHGDFEVRPTTPWNHGLVASGRAVAGLTFDGKPVGAVPFSPDGAGMVATATARRMPSWKLDAGWAAEIAPPNAAWADPGRTITTDPEETVTLIPYGCTNIRITEFPKLSQGRPSLQHRLLHARLWR